MDSLSCLYYILNKRNAFLPVLLAPSLRSKCHFGGVSSKDCLPGLQMVSVLTRPRERDLFLSLRSPVSSQDTCSWPNLPPTAFQCFPLQTNHIDDEGFSIRSSGVCQPSVHNAVPSWVWVVWVSDIRRNICLMWNTFLRHHCSHYNARWELPLISAVNI